MAIGLPEVLVVVLNLAIVASVVVVVLSLVRRFSTAADEGRVERLEDRVETLERRLDDEEA